MNSIKKYIWQYSSPVHVAGLAVLGVVLLFWGKELIGDNYFTALPYIVFAIAVIEVVGIATKPKKS